MQHQSFHATSLVLLLLFQVSTTLDLTASATPLPGIVKGWNVSVGTEAERRSAANFFGSKVSEDDSLWMDNVMVPFIGKQLRMTGIDIIERNAFNTLIEVSVKTGTVLWKIERGPHGVCGNWIEHVNGIYTGTARTVGFVDNRSWIETDFKSFLGFKVSNDWGKVEVLTVNATAVVMKYWSYKKAKFVMTWELQNPNVIYV